VSKAEESLTKARLQVMLDGLLSGEGKLRYTSRIPLILNEHAPVSKIYQFLLIFLMVKAHITHLVYFLVGVLWYTVAVLHH